MPGISPQVSAFGTRQSQGIVATDCVEHDAPGGYVFTTVDDGANRDHWFLWVDSAGDLRIITADAAPCLYDEGARTIDFTGFDQDSDGTIVGTQS